MCKVESWIRCESNGQGGYTVDRDGKAKDIIDMAIGTVNMELFDNIDLLRYAKVRTRQMYRDVWRQTDAHDKLMMALETAGRYAFGVLACLGGIFVIGWIITAVERLVFG